MPKITQKQLTIVTLIVIMLVAIGAGYWYRYVRPQNGAQTTSKLASAQNDYKGDARHSEDSQSTNNVQGGAVDNGGDDNTDTSAGITSSSGEITVLEPAKSQSFTSGSILRGRATDVPRVHYRVVDDNVGVIAQGSLNVVNGSFSGTMQFTSKGESGVVDIFTYNQNYNEENNVQIPVRFKD